MNTPRKRRFDAAASDGATTPPRKRPTPSSASSTPTFTVIEGFVFPTTAQLQSQLEVPFTPPGNTETIYSTSPLLPVPIDDALIDPALLRLANPSPPTTAGSATFPCLEPISLPSQHGQIEIPYAFEPSADVSITPDTRAVSEPVVVPIPVQTSYDTQISLEAETHAYRLAMQDQRNDGKGTGQAYKRHQKHYHEWFAQDQEKRASEIQGYTKIPSQPITATKVAAFLQYESTRPKVTHNGLPIPGTKLGVEHIKQCISALEHWRFNHKHEPQYKDDPDSQLSLRQDSRIRAFETEAAARGPQHIDQAHARKAAGSSADSYTSEQLVEASMHYLRQPKTPKQVWQSLRDRAMLLLSTCTAFRGDNIRGLKISDLFARDVPVPEIALDARLMALVCLQNQGKTNTSGRIDEHGAFRHRDPRLCSVGAVAFVLYARFHLLERPRPNFEPQYSEDYGEFGYRSWYDIHLFPSTKGDDVEMSYKNHYNRVKEMHEVNNISVSKVTHGGRVYAAGTAREYGAPTDSVKALGVWNSSDAYRTAYERALPVEAMLGAATFNARDARSHHLPRELLRPPHDLIKMLFPWVEDEMAALVERRRAQPRIADDFALDQFLQLITRFRTILLQDAAIHYVAHPDISLWTYPPFDTSLFRDFANGSVKILDDAETASRHQLSSLPARVAQTFHGISTTYRIEQQRDQDETRQRLDGIENLIGVLYDAVTAPGSSRYHRNSQRQPNTALVVNSASLASSSPSPPILNHPAPSLSSPSSTSSFQPSSTISLSPTLTSCTSQQSVPAPPNYLLSPDPILRKRQELAMDALKQAHGIERVRSHHWAWLSTKSTDPEEWIPIYKLNEVTTIAQIWEEYSLGLNGCFGWRQLEELWGTKWRRCQGGVKSEISRRKKVTKLIEELSKRPNWTIPLALRFLDTCYPISSKSSTPHLRTPRLFINELSRKGSALESEIHQSAQTFSSR